MTLHETVESSKKAAVGGGIGIGIILIIVVLFNVGKVMYNILFPPPIQPPNYAYGKLPPIQFPPSKKAGNFTFSVQQTANGDLPTDFPDRLNIYQVQEPQSGLDNLKLITAKIQTLGFVDQSGKIPDPIKLDGINYEWDENNTFGFSRKITFDTVSFNFKLTSNFISQRLAKEGNNLEQDSETIQLLKEKVAKMQLMYPDIDLEKTKNPNKDFASIIRGPEYLTINNSELQHVDAFADANVIRVDLYQQNMLYSLNTGISNNDHILQPRDMDVPIVYPDPPYSTMSFWLASTENGEDIVQADFVHQTPIVPTDGSELATYGIKSPKEAFDELSTGKAYIAAYYGSDSEIRINNVYLAYYLGRTQQQYLMPVMVFEGKDGFIAYISAVKNDWITE